ncbi:aspartate/glutamate racemase family protein [Roseicyclus persicicus]|uniref:Hydrogenase expression protein HupH n=1 Tax=Roseicyclus persicicus TaxID=2650661 RepID=A0A7X6GYR1_9RHOB|nr:aspartate/glutamate racemase family protein [Roseibacterium persicicum]NKX43612.1 hydrogenase expression protein HupH [Roseibacterium persicicum]
MRIALVNPNTSADITRRMVAIAAREAGGRAEVIGHTAAFGAPLITEPAAFVVAAEAVAALAPSLGQADAVIVAAFSDPGLDALRAALPCPVTGIAEAGMAEAARGGRRFAVVTTTPALAVAIAATAARHGHRHFAGTWTTPGDPVALTADAAALEDALAAAIEAAVAEGGAEAVVIGGGPLAEAARALAARTPVPLVEPVPAAVRLSVARLQQGAQA